MCGISDDEESPQPVLLSPFQTEWNAYVKWMVDMPDEELLEIDALSFWPTMSVKHPILTRCARQILPIQVCFSTVEQLFSSAGIIDAPRRNNLTPAHFEE